MVGLPTPLPEDNGFNLNPFACPPQREIWPDFFGRADYPTLSSEPGSAIVMTFVLRVFKTYPQMFERGRPTPFIHPSQLENEIGRPLMNCIRVLSGLKESVFKDVSIIHGDASNEIIALLAGYKDYDETDLLAALQAYILYAIVLLFFEGKWDRPHRVEQGIIFGLQDISLRLAASGVLLNAEVNSEIPDWGEWVIAASKRRTILAAHQVLWIWSLLRGYPPFACRELGFMPSPAPKVLWQSRGNDWQHLYEDWMTRWQGGPHRLEELQALGPEVETDTRTQMWLEEADEFGVLLMSEDIQEIDVVNENLEGFARSTKVMVNAIGPYTRYGQAVVAACAAAGTSYVDFSTETPWIEEMIRKYHGQAKENHAVIIPAIGNSSSPSALIAFLLAEQFHRLHGTDVQEIVSCYAMKINGMSGGSLASVTAVVDTYGIRHLLFPDPYRLCSIQEKAPPQRSAATNKPFLGHIKDPVLGHLATSFTAAGNEAIVKRSQLFPQTSAAIRPQFTYQEFMPAASFTQAIVIHLLTKFGILMLALWPFRALIDRLKPGSGSGPSADVTKSEKLEITAVARGQGGEKLVAEYVYHGPMYYHTAVLGATAVAVLLDLWKDREGRREQDFGEDLIMSGILTPSCLGMPFIERLRAAGVKLEVLV